MEDFRKLDEVARHSQSITVIGGGFLGSELSFSLKKRHRELEVYQVFREKGNVGLVLPEFLARHASDRLRASGVRVLAEREVLDATFADEKVLLHLDDGTTISSDHVVLAVGIVPDTSLAVDAALEIDPVTGGYRVDAELRARSDVYVVIRPMQCRRFPFPAGDASSFYDVKLGRRRRVEHWEHAQVTGRLAGENMTGAGRPYWHQSSFYSLVGPDATFDAVGLVDASLETVSVFLEQTASDDRLHGVVFYLVGKRVRGVLLFNVEAPGGIDIARKIIADGREYDDFRELAKLFELHKTHDDEK